MGDELNQVHVVPMQDSKRHVVALDETCWCAPTIQQETPTNSTHIHRPLLPLVRGHALDLRKILVTPAGMVEVAR